MLNSGKKLVINNALNRFYEKFIEGRCFLNISEFHGFISKVFFAIIC